MKRLVLIFALLSMLGTQSLAENALDAKIDAVLDVCIEELGYTATKGGFSKYGEWAGGSYKEWCSEFMSWSTDQAGVRLGEPLLDVLYPMQVECQTGVNWFVSQGRYVTVPGSFQDFGDQWHWEDGVPTTERPYIPSKGDMIYIEWYKYNRIDHVGIVEYLSKDVDGTVMVHTIEGNNKILGPEPTNVQRYAYRLDDASIRGYGITRDDAIGTTLRRGDENAGVKAVQEWLTSTGYYNGKISGSFGSATEKALRAFQKDQGFAQTGIADAETQRALRSSAEK